MATLMISENPSTGYSWLIQPGVCDDIVSIESRMSYSEDKTEDPWAMEILNDKEKEATEETEEKETEEKETEEKETEEKEEADHTAFEVKFRPEEREFMTGVGGTKFIQLKALGVGSCLLRIAYARDWEFNWDSPEVGGVDIIEVELFVSE